MTFVNTTCGTKPSAFRRAGHRHPHGRRLICLGGRARHPTRIRSSSSSSREVVVDGYPAFVPDEMRLVEEQAAHRMARRIQREDVALDALSEPVGISYVGPQAESTSDHKPPVVLLHGFDSSCLEFRRLYPLLEDKFAAYAVDVLGWGFTDSRNQDCGAGVKQEALIQFLIQKIGQPVIIIGASLGGALAINVAATRPDLVSNLVLIDAQGFQDGIGPMQYLPGPIAKLAIEVLRSVPLRQAANKMSYFDKDGFATEDAMRIGRLHCFKEDWISGNASFIKSGGFIVSENIRNIEQPTLVIWGEDDGILPEEDRHKFGKVIPNTKLQIISECGHVPHLEKPQQVATIIEEAFL